MPAGTFVLMLAAMLTAPATLTEPAPKAKGDPVRCSAVNIRAALTAFGVIDGFFWSISATAPATTGVAMLVPLILIYEEPIRNCGKLFARVEPELMAATTCDPGAVISGLIRCSTAVGPRELYVATVSSERSSVPQVVMAPTVITAGSLPGLVMPP